MRIRFFSISFLLIWVATAFAGNPVFFALNTSAAAPPNVTGLAALEDTTTTMLLFWTSGGGTTSSYRISYQSGASAPASCTTGTQVSEATVGSATNYIVTGLTANTQYSFRVCASSASSTYASGTTVTIKTPPSQPIFRSMGFNSTAAKATGASNSMAVSGSIITFTSGLANNIGIGDAIQYSTANNATMDKVVFVHGRLSSTQFLVKTASGGTPTAVSGNTTWSLFRAYTSINNALAGTENTGIAAAVRNFDTWTGGANLTTLASTWYIECYADAIHASTFADVSTSWVTSASNKIYITSPWETRHVGTRQRHQGIWSSSYFTASVTDNNVIEVDVSNVVIEGLQLEVDQVSGGFMAAIMIGAENQIAANAVTEINGNIILATSSAAQADVNGIFANWVNSGIKIYATNNVVICTGGGGKTCIRGIRGAYNNADSLSFSAYLYNNTIVGNWDYGIEFSNAGTGILTVYAKNNIVQGTTWDAYLAKAWGSGSGYNVSGNATTTGAASDKASKTVSFVSSALKDYHLSASDTSAKDAGTDLSADANYPVTMDIDATTRSGTWDIGADSL